MEGKIVLIVLPQDSQQKLRPALALREFPKYGDILVCGISTQLHQYITDFDLLLDQNHADFAMSGIKTPSVCRLSMLAMVPQRSIRGSIGKLSFETHANILKRLSEYLIKK